jgi:hypothetical protein
MKRHDRDIHKTFRSVNGVSLSGELLASASYHSAQCGECTGGLLFSVARVGRLVSSACRTNQEKIDRDHGVLSLHVGQGDLQ